MSVFGHFVKLALKGLIETGGFEAKVLEAVLTGAHYVRSFRGMLILSSAISSLKWSAFSETINDDQFNEINEKFKELSSNLIKKSKVQGCTKYDECKREIDSPKSKYNMFVKDRASSSELCKYWNLILKFMNLLKQLIVADREGNLNTHPSIDQGLLPLFRAANSLNYLHYGSWYLPKNFKSQSIKFTTLLKAMESHRIEAFKCLRNRVSER